MQSSTTPTRPLKAAGLALSRWARGTNVQTTVAHSGRIRTAIDNVGIALQWMSRGYQYDTRSFAQRMRAGNWYWRRAARALFWSAA